MYLYAQHALTIDFQKGEDWRAPTEEQWKAPKSYEIIRLQAILGRALGITTWEVREHFVPTRSCTDALLAVKGCMPEGALTSGPGITFPATYRCLSDNFIIRPMQPKRPWLLSPDTGQTLDVAVELYGIPTQHTYRPRVVDAAHSLPSPRHWQLAAGGVHVCFSFGPLKLVNMPLGGGYLGPSASQVWEFLSNRGERQGVKGLLELPFLGPLAERLRRAPGWAQQCRIGICQINTLTKGKVLDGLHQGSGHLCVLWHEDYHAARAILDKAFIQHSCHYKDPRLVTVPCHSAPDAEQRMAFKELAHVP